MKTLTLIAGLFLSSQSFAAQNLVFDCRIDAFGIQSLTVTEDSHTSTKQLTVQFSNGELTQRSLGINDLENMSNQGLYLAQDGELNITLTKQRVDQYIYDYTVLRKGDGYYETAAVSCSN